MNKDLERQVQKMIDEGQSEETIGQFIQNKTKQIDSESTKVINNSINNSNKTNGKIEFKEGLENSKTSILLKLFPFAFDVALVILLSNLIVFFGEVRDYYDDEILFSFSTLFSMIILSKWYWSYKGKITSITIKNYIFYILLFGALLFGIFYINLLPE